MTLTSVELESIVVKLTGDGSSFQKMLATAQESAKTCADAVQAAGQKIEDISKSLTGFASTAMSALAGFGATGFLKTAFGQFVEMESSLLKLTSAIEVNGREAGPLIEHYREMAASLRDTTGAAIGSTMALYEQAERLGLSGTAADQAVKDAIGLSKSLGTSAEAQLRNAKAIQEGNAQMFHRVAALRGVHGDTEKLTKMQEYATKGFETAKKTVDSAENVMKRYDAAVKSLTRQFGQFVAEAVLPVIRYTTLLIERFGKLDEESKRLIVAAAFLVAGILAIGPALAAVNAWVMPVVTLMLSGFGMIGTALTFLASPLTVMATAFKVVAVVLSPLNVALAAAAGLVALFVNHMGGLNATWDMVKRFAFDAWDKVKAWGVEAWEKTKAAALDFWQWIRPTVETMQALFGVMWEGVKRNAAPAWEAVKDAVSGVWDKVKELQSLTAGWAVGFIQQNQGLVFTLAAVAAAAALCYGAFQVLTFTLTLLHAEQIAGVAVWISWNAAVVAAAVVAGTYNIVLIGVKAAIAGIVLVQGFLKAAFSASTLLMIAQKSVLGILTAVAWVFNAAYAGINTVMLFFLGQLPFQLAGYTAWSVVVGIAKGVVWLFNAALTATNILLGGGAIIAAVATVGLLAVAFSAVGGAVYAVYKTGNDLYSLLTSLPTTSGPIKEVIALFEEWKGIVMDIVRAAKVDMDLAWGLVVAGATLAVEQLKVLWPPLWNYIKTGFTIAWELASAVATKYFNKAFLEILKGAGGLLGALAMMASNPVMAGVIVGSLIGEIKAKADKESTIPEAIARANLDLDYATKKFDDAMRSKDTEAIEAAREKVDLIRISIGLAEGDAARASAKAKTKAVEDAKKAGEQVGSSYNKGFDKEAHKFNAALFFSTEALGRYADYVERLNQVKPTGVAGAAVAGAAAAAGGGGVPKVFDPGEAMKAEPVAAAVPDADKMVLMRHMDMLLQLIADNTTKGEGVTVTAAGL